MHNMPELMCRLMKARSVTFNLRYITAGKHDNEPIFFLFNDTPVCHYWMFKLMVCWNWWWKIVHVHNPLLNMNSFCGSILLVCSASGYFSSTSITFYISSKHGITGLLHASRTLPLKKYHICINSVAPSMVPTHITGGYLEKWIREGHCFNTTEDVAWVIAQMANDEKMHSKCVMVVGGKMWEVEGPIQSSMGGWVGDEASEVFREGWKFMQKWGGYPLPGDRRM